jgi:hypothetical protein
MWLKFTNPWLVVVGKAQELACVGRHAVVLAQAKNGGSADDRRGRRAPGLA